MLVIIGMRPFFASATAAPNAERTVTSAGVHSNCAPRATSDAAASATAAVFSTLASITSMPRSAQACLARSVLIFELASAGFHGMPTTFKPGKNWRAMAAARATGCIVP